MMKSPWTIRTAQELRFEGYNIGQIAATLNCNAAQIYGMQNAPEGMPVQEISRRVARIERSMSERQIRKIMAEDYVCK